MYRNENISARTKSRLAKEDCFNRNIPILNILFYIGGGFMLRKQITALVRIFYSINGHRANDMLADLLAYGLLVKKQATGTKTCIYIMTKFPLAMCHECSTRDSCSVKLNNRKIWNNIYRTEFLIRQAVPFMEQLGMELTLENLLNFLTDYCISVFTTENQMSVYQLYGNLYEHFPIKDKELLSSGFPCASDFMNDYYKITADLYHHQRNFLGYKIEDDFSGYLEVKDMLEREKDLVSSPKELKRNYYSLFNMAAAGFFFIGKPNSENITIGTFDKCNNMYLKKIYENIICIYLMLERYLGFYPKITLQVYMSDADRILSLRDKEAEQGFYYDRQENSGLTKRDSFFQNMKIPMQNWDDIHVDYICYPLREKYNL
ncbi:MAG: hypothetical protein NC548_35670 [Lachnospiraceae bacterium]|nr:hypothetical protein [Lachnospiraceae bacterium]